MTFVKEQVFDTPERPAFTAGSKGSLVTALPRRGRGDVVADNDMHPHPAVGDAAVAADAHATYSSRIIVSGSGTADGTTTSTPIAVQYVASLPPNRSATGYTCTGAQRMSTGEMGANQNAIVAKLGAFAPEARAEVAHVLMGHSDVCDRHTAMFLRLLAVYEATLSGWALAAPVARDNAADRAAVVRSLVDHDVYMVDSTVCNNGTASLVLSRACSPHASVAAAHGGRPGISALVGATQFRIITYPAEQPAWAAQFTADDVAHVIRRLLIATGDTEGFEEALRVAALAGGFADPRWNYMCCEVGRRYHDCRSLSPLAQFGWSKANDMPVNAALVAALYGAHADVLAEANALAAPPAALTAWLQSVTEAEAVHTISHSAIIGLMAWAGPLYAHIQSVPTYSPARVVAGGNWHTALPTAGCEMRLTIECSAGLALFGLSVKGGRQGESSAPRLTLGADFLRRLRLISAVHRAACDELLGYAVVDTARVHSDFSAFTNDPALADILEEVHGCLTSLSGPDTARALVNAGMCAYGVTEGAATLASTEVTMARICMVADDSECTMPCAFSPAVSASLFGANLRPGGSVRADVKLPALNVAGGAAYKDQAFHPFEVLGLAALQYRVAGHALSIEEAVRHDGEEYRVPRPGASYWRVDESMAGVWFLPVPHLWNINPVGDRCPRVTATDLGLGVVMPGWEADGSFGANCVQSVEVPGQMATHMDRCHRRLLRGCIAPSVRIIDRLLINLHDRSFRRGMNYNAMITACANDLRGGTLTLGEMFARGCRAFGTRVKLPDFILGAAAPEDGSVSQ